MKLSIWQQFSSNHSNSFAVVGRFASTDDAQEVASQFREWMTKIVWKPKGLSGWIYVTDTEKEIQQTYEIDWYEKGLDWNGKPENIDKVVGQFQADVFLICPVETWDPIKPFVDLMTKLGATQVIPFYGEYQMVLHLTCTQPDETTLQTFYEHTKHELELRLEDFRDGHFLWAGFGSSPWRELAYGNVKLDNEKLEMHLMFYYAEGVMTVLNYLEKNAFQNIEYHISYRLHES